MVETRSVENLAVGVSSLVAEEAMKSSNSDFNNSIQDIDRCEELEDMDINANKSWVEKLVNEIGYKHQMISLSC